jgi:hypothetical protein
MTGAIYCEEAPSLRASRDATVSGPIGPVTQRLFTQGLVVPDIWRGGTPKPDRVSWFEPNAPVSPAL